MPRAHLPVQVDLGLDHELDVLCEVVDAVDPHDDDRLKNSQPKNRHTPSVGVHDVKYKRSGLGNTGKAAEKKNKFYI